MFKPCEICLEETCEGRHDCDCDNCKVQSQCYRYLFPTIRITTKCTQTCKHCCFECSPDSKEFMSTNSAIDIKRFILSNNINCINLMGGEFVCHPQWKQILNILMPDIEYVRIVTNGDWDESVPKFLQEYSEHVVVAISEDQWHNNKNVSKAIKLCKEYKIPYSSGKGQMDSAGIVPVGRGEFSSSIYSSLMCYCQNPAKMYSFLIDETGNIYKCGFGVWKYDNINGYVDGGFNKRFKTFNKKFYSNFISSCMRCHMAYQLNGKNMKGEKHVATN